MEFNFLAVGEHKLQITYLATGSLVPNKRNPRGHSKKQILKLAKSLERETGETATLANGETFSEVASRRTLTADREAA